MVLASMPATFSVYDVIFNKLKLLKKVRKQSIIFDKLGLQILPNEFAQIVFCANTH